MDGDVFKEWERKRAQRIAHENRNFITKFYYKVKCLVWREGLDPPMGYAEYIVRCAVRNHAKRLSGSIMRNNALIGSKVKIKLPEDKRNGR